MTREQIITREVKRHDPSLYCKRMGPILCILRKDWSWEEYEIDGTVVSFLKPQPYHVMALTDTWSVHGKPVEWGVLPILERLKHIDLWNQGVTANDLQAQHEKVKASKLNDFRNTTEAVLSEMRPQFAKATNDINTSLLAKIDKRRIKDGSRK
jgi:hypothetical protein